MNFGTLLKVGEAEVEKRCKGEYLNTRQHLTERWRKTRLVTSKFIHFTKCCFGEHIKANDTGANLKKYINTLVAKGT